MERILALIALALSVLALPGVAHAQDYPTSRTIATERWVEEWDPASQRWVRVSDDAGAMIANGHATSVTTTTIVNGVVVSQTQTTMPMESHERFALPISQPQVGAGIAQYGPFRVIDGKRAAIVDSTDQSSPAYFAAMLRDHPGLEVLEMIEAPGTRHDIANLKVGRMIREAGLRTHVPAGGSVRSGAVELFLAGTEQTMEDGATFAVHSWLDNYGRQPRDFPEDHPANRLYLDYYVEMGMTKDQAREFYAMTNSVPHESALWLGAAEMRPWVSQPQQMAAARHVLALADAPVLVASEGPLVVPVFDEAPMPIYLAAIEPFATASADNEAMPGVTLAYADMSLLDS